MILINFRKLNYLIDTKVKKRRNYEIFSCYDSDLYVYINKNK